MFCKLRLVIGSLLFIHGQLVAEIHGSPVNPSSDASAMGTYGFEKEEECNRICWYRKLCTSYSYHPEMTTKSNNCVLYAGLTHAPLPGGWVVKNVGSSGITNGCAPRPCGEADICVPQESSQAFKCSYQPSECPIITPTPHSTLDYTIRKQDVRASVKCHRNYVLVPLGTSDKIQCKVTSQWEEFKGTCSKAVFNAPIPEKIPIPLQIRDGWKGCVRGVYLGNIAGAFNFLANNSTNTILLHIALRSKDYWVPNEVITNALIVFPDGWKTEQNHGAMPLTDGDKYKLSFELRSDLLILNLFSETIWSRNTYNIPLSINGYNLKSATYLEIAPDKFRSGVIYVNLVSGC